MSNHIVGIVGLFLLVIGIIGLMLVTHFDAWLYLAVDAVVVLAFTWWMSRKSVQ